MSPYQNIELICKNCGAPFTWSEGEQEFMNDLREKGKLDKLDINTGETIPGQVKTPTRCRECRLKKKQERESRY